MHKIIKNIFLFFSTAFFLSCATSGTAHNIKKPPTKSFVKVFHKVSVSSCSEGTKNCPIGSWMATGSGMAIDLHSEKMTVVTAGHVCHSEMKDFIKEHSQSVSVMDFNGNVHQAYVVDFSLHNSSGSPDICILWVPTLKTEKIQISKKPPQIGDELQYIGAPKGVFHPPVVPIFKGIFSGQISTAKSILTAPAAGGSSGSAVLNKNNELVGVLFAVNGQFQNISLITSYHSSLLFFARARKELINIDPTGK